MTAAKRKLLMRRDELIGAVEAPCASALYEQIAFAMEAEFDALRQQEILPVVPRSSASKPGTIERTALGAMRQPFMSVLGLSDLIIDYVVSGLTPCCPHCGRLAGTSRTLAEIRLPLAGTIVLALTGDDRAFTVRERCELLGSERALVGGRIKGLDELDGDAGEPIIAVVPARERARLEDEAQRWFGRGGGSLQVLHFTTRDAVGSNLGDIYGGWWCEGCACTLEPVTRVRLEGCSPCVACRGEGWLVAKVDGVDRAVACRECDGYGATDVISRAEFHGVPLRYISTLRFADLLRWQLPDGPLREALLEVLRCGLGDVRLGAPVDVCSPGERALISVLIGRLYKLSRARFLLDGAYAPFEAAVRGANEATTLVYVARPHEEPTLLPPWNKLEVSKAHIILRSISAGPLRIPEVSFPVGAITAIEGPIGSGKSLLLKTIQQRFMTRKKVAHLASFGNLKRCSYIEGLVGSEGTIVDLLNVGGDIAHEIARTRRAKELGFLEPDLLPGGARYRCQECLGSGCAADGSVCEACGGSLYDWQVSSLPLLGATVAEVMYMPLGRLGELLWSSPRVEAAVRVAAQLTEESVCLATPARELSPCARRCIAILARAVALEVEPVGRTAASRNVRLDHELVLIDGPHAWSDRFRDVLLAHFGLLLEKGATIVYAGAPKNIASVCHAVISLKCVDTDWESLAREQFLDTRYARESHSASEKNT